ncbi:MAG: HPr kinase/phosphatase C-terminal domain-containing protein [Aestuariivirgaceae bacterium]
MATASETLHATCLSVQGRGILLCGPSGCGKSDLALRLITTLDARLVADDQVTVERRGSLLVGRAPAKLCGLFEVRGLGIVRMEYEHEAGLAMLFRLKPHAAIERLPERPVRQFSILGISIPETDLDPAASSAPQRLLMAMDVAFNPLRLQAPDV